ncbi:MAG: 4Fe-4S binding protein [Vulcanibacillus sp.]
MEKSSLYDIDLNTQSKKYKKKVDSMGNLKSKIKMTKLRRILQGFLLVAGIIYLIQIIPNNETFLIAILLIILITVVFRTGFCGWICPLGTIFDFIRKIGKLIGSIPFMRPINKNYKIWINNNRNLLNKIDKYARYFKYIFLLWMMQAAFIAEGDQHESVNSLLIFLFFVIIGLFIDRSWCKYCCPLGATLGLVGKISPTKVERDENLCIDCDLCTKICPINIDVAHKKIVNDKDCNTCLECVDVCPVEGALDLKFTSLTMKKFKISKDMYGVIIIFILIIGLIVIKLVETVTA